MTAVHAYDHLLSCAKAVQPLVDQIMEAPVNAAKLQVELDRPSAEIASARQTLAAERASWQIEWKSLRDASDHAATQRELETADWEAKLSEKQEELQRVQNSIAAVTKRLEKLAALFRKFDRMVAQPSAGAAGLQSVVAEMVELIK
jgi:chromosome segregation ATPase